MNEQVKNIRLRSTGVKARVIVRAKNDIAFLVGYIYAPTEQMFKSQIIFLFCENYLKDVIPELVGKDKEFRTKVFKELYSSIVTLNPDITKSWKPTAAPVEGGVMKVLVPKVGEVKVNLKFDKPPATVTKELVRSLSSSVKESIFGQDEAIDLIQKYFEIAFSGLGDPMRPRGSFLFAGQTGTGKTETVKELSRHLWGPAWRDGLFTINGSEYMEEHETAKLLGSPQGYVGYDDGSPFLKHVSANPETIVLVDEFEKAHPRLQDVFLQILDEGACYDNKGNRIDFTKTVIVFTSNIGTKEVYYKNSVGFGDREKDLEAVSNSVDAALSKFCRAEFVKRFDGIVIFNQLKPEHYEKICAVELSRLSDRMSEQGLKLKYSTDVLSSLVSKLGEGDTARDLNTIVRKEIGSKIASMIVTDEEFDMVELSCSGDEIKVRGAKNERPKERAKKKVSSGPESRRPS